MNRTVWFPPNIKPVHVGYYETSRDPREYHVMDYWDGNWWKYSKSDKKYYVLTTMLFWRGVEK